MGDTIQIIEKQYLPEQQKLLDILKQHAQSVMPEHPVVFKMPNIPNRARKRICGIPCKTIGKRGDEMMVAMEVIDFIRMMVKNGIEVKIHAEE